jgi:hypothetical protein
MLINKIRNLNTFHKIMALFIFCSIFVSVHTLHRDTFFTLNRVDEFSVERVMRTIQNNLEIFENSPTQNITTIYNTDFQFTSSGAVLMSSGDILQAYEYLSLHPSWLLNYVLTRVLLLGSHLMLAGVLISTQAYKIDSLQRSSEVMKRQLLYALCFVLIYFVLMVVFGWVSVFIRHIQLGDTSEMQLAMSLYNIEGLWLPNVLYYTQAIGVMIIFLFCYILFGVLVGHIFANGIAALVLLWFVTHNYFAVLLLYPFFPFYFTYRLVANFLMPTPSIPTVPSENLLFNLTVFAGYMGILVLLSALVLRLRRLKSSPATSD